MGYFFELFYVAGALLMALGYWLGSLLWRRMTTGLWNPVGAVSEVDSEARERAS